ncbi:MAG: hypothetical protein F6K23_34125 [Okeania sp. SIO2C9]|uniref:hypothetical protein n=1 Tax=Okeania sp. SIO2C9 TaxID=2607791 RepID=UPI0013C0D6E3|nr:hypothetical protein [Okeania sp. SIO2C9]NEQ77611.1 hypothetical protein [Okeania sp. SIO2C9]
MAVAVYTKHQNYFQNIHNNHRIIDDTDEDDNRVGETISISQLIYKCYNYIFVYKSVN